MNANYGLKINLTKHSDIIKIASKMRKNKKLMYSSDMGIMMALNDAKKDGDSIIILNKELKTKPTTSEFSIIEE